MKKAYPNLTDEIISKPVYNLNKWVEAMREIYTKVHFGANKNQVVESMVQSWSKQEINDFKNWLSFYEDGNGKKYNLKPKLAQMYMPENISGYYLPNHVPSPIVHDRNKVDLSDPIETVVKPSIVDNEDKVSKRYTIEEQRKKIIGRLNAAIKNLTTMEGHLLAGDEFDNLLSSLYDLLKKFQTINKKSSSIKIYEDLIIRESNLLNKKGFERSSNFLYKFAQNAAGGPNITSSPLPITNKDNGGSLDNLNTVPALNDTVKRDKKFPTDPLDKLIDNINTSGITDLNNLEDVEIIIEIEPENEVLVTEAQIAVPTQNNVSTVPVTPAVSKAPEEEKASNQAPGNPNSANEQTDTGAQVEQKSDNIDEILDKAFSNATIEDVLAKLQNLNTIYQNRVISKELAIIEILMSKLGLTTYFSSLSEIIAKNNESINYISSRISEIILTLQGAVNKTKDNLNEIEENTVSPEVKAVQDVLSKEDDKEKQRKQLRREQEQAKLEQSLLPKKEDDVEGQEESSPSPQEAQTTPTPKVV